MTSSPDAQPEILDAQLIFHPREASPDLPLDLAVRDRVAVDMAVLAMECVGVHGALWHGERGVVDTAVERYPDLFRGIVHYDEPEAIDDVDSELAWVEEHPGLVGIRLTPGWPADGSNMERFRAGAYERWLQGAERHDLVLSLFMPGHLREAHRVADRYPSLRILIDHIGMFPPPAAPLLPDRLDAIPELLELARHENVAVKFTGVPSLSYEEFPFADLWPASHQILDAFGPKRMMWGSDFRRIRSLHSYEQLVDFLRVTDEVSPEEKRQLMSESLRSWIRWERT